MLCKGKECQSPSQHHFCFLSVFVPCCLWWEQEVWSCVEIAAARQERDIKYTHQVSKITDLMKDFSFLLGRRMCYLFCNKTFFFFCFHVILVHIFLSLSFLLLDSLSLFLFSLSTSIFFFFSTSKCLPVTEQLNLNMSTRPGREILKSCRKKIYPGVTADRQRQAVLSYPKHFTMALWITSESCQDGHLHGTVYGHPLFNIFLTTNSVCFITSKSNSQSGAWGNREDSKALFCKIVTMWDGTLSFPVRREAAQGVTELSASVVNGICESITFHLRWVSGSRFNPWWLWLMQKRNTSTRYKHTSSLLLPGLFFSGFVFVCVCVLQMERTG